MKEQVTQQEFDALVSECMANDIDAGGDPDTSHDYATRWARSKYEVVPA
jgi:hypothetical protein